MRGIYTRANLNARLLPLKMAFWSDKETVKLIEIWGEEAIQEQLEGCKRNRDVYDKIAREMSKAGFTRTGLQCREKIKKLKGEYKKVKDKNKETGNNRKTCKFYEELDVVLGHKPATRPPVIRDTLSDTLEESSGNAESSQASDEETPLNNSGNSEGGGRSDSDKTDDDTKADDEKVKIKKAVAPKKRSREEKIEKTMETFVKGISKVLGSSDERFIVLEEKRMKFEEIMLKMEEDRLKESEAREERRRKEEREFQLKLFSILHGNNNLAPPPSMMPPNYYYNPGSNSGSSTASCDPMYEWSAND